MPQIIEVNGENVEFPDGMPASEIEKVLAAQMPKAQTEPTGVTGKTRSIDPKPIESVIPHMIDKAKQGVAATMALPAAGVDIIQGGLDLATAGAKKLLAGTEKKGVSSLIAPEAKKAADDWFIGNAPDKENVGGYKMAKRGIESLLRLDRGVDADLTKEVKAPTDLMGGVSKANEYLGKISEFVGGALVPGAGPVAAAQRKLLTALTEAGGAAASAVSSVEAKELGGHLAPTFGLTKEQGEQTGEILGSVMGPKLIQLGAQTAAKGLSGANTAANKLNFTGLSAEAQKDAAKMLLNQDLLKAVEHSPESAENVARVIAIQQKMAGFAPNAAQATNAPGLVAMTKEVAKSSPESLAKAAAVDARNVEAINNFKEKNFPATSLPVNEGARAKFSVDSGMLRADLQRTDEALANLSDKYTRSVDKGQVGQELRDLYWAKKGEARTGLDKQIGDVYSAAKQYNVKEDMGDVREAIQKVVGSDKESFQQMPGVWKQILEKYPAQKGPQPMLRVQPSNEASFEELHSLYKQANREWMDMVAAGRPDQAQKLDVVRQMLTNKVNKYNDPAYGDLSQKFQDFNKNYAQYAQTFKQGAGGAMGQMTKKGYAKDAEDIVDKVFLRSGDKSKGIEDFFSVYGRDERAGKLLSDGLTDNFARSAVDKNGNFNAAGAAQWMKKNESALDLLPATRDKLRATTDEAGALVDRRLELNAQRKMLDRTTMASAAGSIRPELLVEDGMRDPRMFKALLASAKTDESRQSLARGIVDMTAAKADSFDFVTKNEKTLKPVMDALGKDHWDNLKILAEADQIANRVTAPKNVELSKIQDPAEKLVGTSGKGLLSRAMNAEKGYMSKPYLVADLAGRFIYKIRSEEMARLREAALFDPEISNVLAKVVTKERPAPKDLLDLKALAHQAGIVITAQGVSARANQDKPEQRRRPVADPLEGVGKWK